MNQFIDVPVEGWYSITGPKHPGQRRKLRIAGRIYRECMCDGMLHELRDDCTRHPPIVADIEGSRRNPFAVWHATGRTRITETEALSLMGQENLYV